MTDLSTLCQLLCRLTSRPPPTPGSTSSSLGSTPSASSSGPTPSGSTPSTLQQQLQQPLKLRQPVLGSGFGDVSSFVYPVLATLASYPTHLDRKAQVHINSIYRSWVAQGFLTSKANLNFLSTCTYVCTCTVLYYGITVDHEIFVVKNFSSTTFSNEN